MKTLDYRQFQCPYPVVETRKALLAHPDEELQVLVTDQISADNIGRLATSRNYQLQQQPADSGFLLTLTPVASTAMPPVTGDKVGGKSVIFCGSEQMGDGDAELGRILLQNFFVTLTELEVLPDAILFVNAGVKLACQGSEALEALHALACRGVDIAACGLCLDFYHLKERLQVGRTTNMLEIAATTLQAGRVIRP